MDDRNTVIHSAIHYAGLVNAAAGVCVGLAYVLHPHHATPEIVGSSFWFWVHILFLLSLIGGIFGTMGIFAYHSNATGWPGLVGMVLIIVSLTFIFGLNYWEIFINPVVAAEIPDFVRTYGAGETIGLVAVVFPATGIMFMAGYLLLCTDIIKKRTLPAGSAWLTMIGVVVFGAGLSGVFPMFVVKIGSILFAFGLISLGMALWMHRA